MLECLCLAEWNSIKRFTQAFPFPWDFNLKCWSNLPVFHFLYRLMKSSVIFYGSSVLQQTFILFFPFSVSQGEQLKSISHCQVKQGNGHRENWWGLSMLGEMMKQAIYALLSHTFTVIPSIWHKRPALELALSLKCQKAVCTVCLPTFHTSDYDTK